MSPTVSSPNPDDIFMWPDVFWCFRNELSDGFMRKDDYRVIAHKSEEWKVLIDKQAPGAKPKRTRANKKAAG